MEATVKFREQVKKEWGQTSRVADVAFDELFRHGDDISLDDDDQVSYAMKVGILAGELKDSNPETFIQRFEAEVLNGD